MDYSEMTPEAIHEIGIIMSNIQTHSFLYALAFIAFIGIILISIFEVRKSKKYREFLSDMFVAGKIRSYAKEDKINLDAENIKFMNWSKKKRNEMLSLDSAIEEDLKDRIADDKLKVDIGNKSAQDLIDKD